MRLDIRLPQNWTTTRHPDGSTVSVAPDTVRAKVIIHVLPIVPRPQLPVEWMETTVIKNLVAPDCRPIIVSRRDLLSSVTWPLNVYDVDVNRGDVLVQRHLYVLYFLLEYCALTYAIVSDPSHYPELRDELLRVMASGLPDWTSNGEVVALSELYAGLPVSS
jgi:hypothetical protein